MNSPTSIPLFDSHAHLEMVKGGEEQIYAQIDRAFENGLEGIIAIASATGAEDVEIPLHIADKYPAIWVAAGIHPHTASDASKTALDGLRFILDREKVVALGEIGLDYHYNHSPPREQRKAFVRQIQVAHQHHKPLVIHTREADADTISILRDEGANELGGVIHCFSSGVEMAVQSLELGFYLSFSGIVTFPNAVQVQEAASHVPIERLLAETDSPFLSPIPFRGKPNEPARVLHVVEKLAEIKQMEPAKMGVATVANTRKCFDI